MASTKLSPEDKKAIVELYQEAGQTAATVAEKYGVSVSTISRLLKSSLPSEEYEALVRQKRGGGEGSKTKKRASRKKPVSKLKKKSKDSTAEQKQADGPSVTEVIETDVAEEASEMEIDSPAELTNEETETPTRSRRRRTRSSASKKRPVSRRKTKALDEVSSSDLSQPSVAEESVAATTDIEPAETEPAETEPPAEVEQAELEKADAGRPKPVKRAKPKLKRAEQNDEPADEAVNDESADEAVIDPLEAPVEAESKDIDSQPRRRTRRRTRTRAVVEASPKENIIKPEEEVATPDEDELVDKLILGNFEGEDEGFDDAFEQDDGLESEDDSSDNITSLRRRTPGESLVQIQPLSEANLSRMLYLVIDRTADLITMPMVFFSDLGQLPEEEEEKKTLPVFENHRVARRFSQRNQRVIKVPDGELISKTAPWLEAKGITRCLLDGQVYSLESADQ